MKTTYITPDGKVVPEGCPVQVDSIRTELKVTVRSMSAISPSVVLAMLNKRFECMEVAIVEEVITVRPR